MNITKSTVDEDKNILTVTGINEYLSGKFTSDPNLKNVTIKGEVSNFVRQKNSGHCYFSLKDENSTIRAAIWKGNAQKIKFDIKDEMNLIVTGSISVYTKKGEYQITCVNVVPDGVGELALAFEQLKEKLSKMQYFDKEHKKELPYLPQNIGVVTSPTGAALQDILNVLTRRYPLGEVTIFPAVVQGDNAAASIVENIQKAEAHGDIDVLIVGRGGGSLEDLWAFNEEIVATAIYNCKIPIISAVGHEINSTISDFVADDYAPTPSAAAELVAPDVVTLMSDINKLQQNLESFMRVYLNKCEQQVTSLSDRLKSNSPNERIEFASDKLETLTKQLDKSIDNLVANKRQQMMASVNTMEALSPLKVLTRGYSITYDENKNIITDASEVSSGDTIITKFSNSEIKSIVE